jgi:hypothetical protein
MILCFYELCPVKMVDHQTANSFAAVLTCISDDYLCVHA